MSEFEPAALVELDPSEVLKDEAEPQVEIPQDAIIEEDGVEYVEVEEEIEEEEYSIYDGLTPEEAERKKAFIEARRARIIGMRDRYRALRANVDAICERCGRDPKEVKIVAVSKTVKAPEVQEAIMAGITDFAENRPNIIVQKAAIFPEVNWHYIGPLETKTCRDVVPCSEIVHSADSLDILTVLHTRASIANTTQKVLLEINVTGEPTKRGLHPRNIDGALRSIGFWPNLECVGFMTMAPKDDPEGARAAFSGLRALMNKYKDKYKGKDNIKLTELSMGMSDDYEIAIEEGATILRIGRAIFDENYGK